MASILVVCTGNVCRSPLAEGILRRELEHRSDRSHVVASAGTAAWQGSPPTAGSVVAARELGIDISGHRARELDADEIGRADLIVAMADEHRRVATSMVPAAAPKTFTLKELVFWLELDRVGEGLAEGELDARLAERVSAADARRAAGGEGARPRGEALDLADPLGMPLETYRELARDLLDLTGRSVQGLFGPVPDPTRDRGAVA